jgi:hypothetical protein
MKKQLFLILSLFSFPLYAELKWEKVSEGVPNAVRDVIYRASVPHGWLVVYTKKSLRFANENIDFGNITFYPDENHEWTL